MEEVLERARRVRLLVLDVDGVLTDGTLFFDASGEALKAFNIRDGHGIRMLAEDGTLVAIITGRRSKALERRAENLGIDLLYQGVDDKLEAFEALTARLGVDPSACAAIGDDLLDLPVLRRCGLAATVPDAPELVKQYVHYVTCTPAGRGAVREFCELILRGQGRFEQILLRYLR